METMNQREELATYWWKTPKGITRNFGDMLNPYLFKRITGREAVHSFPSGKLIDHPSPLSRSTATQYHPIFSQILWYTWEHRISNHRYDAEFYSIDLVFFILGYQLGKQKKVLRNDLIMYQEFALSMWLFK